MYRPTCRSTTDHIGINIGLFLGGSMQFLVEQVLDGTRAAGGNLPIVAS